MVLIKIHINNIMRQQASNYNVSQRGGWKNVLFVSHRFRWQCKLISSIVVITALEIKWNKTKTSSLFGRENREWRLDVEPNWRHDNMKQDKSQDWIRLHVCPRLRLRNARGSLSDVWCQSTSKWPSALWFQFFLFSMFLLLSLGLEFTFL